MLPVRSMHRLLSLVEQSGAKLVLTGDTQQLQPIEAGPGLRLVTDAIGSIRRRRNPSPARRSRGPGRLARWRWAGRCASSRGPDAGTRTRNAAGIPRRFRGREPGRRKHPAALKDRRAGEAIAAYAQRGRFHLCADHGDTLRRLVGDWMTHWRDRPGETRLALGPDQSRGERVVGPIARGSHVRAGQRRRKRGQRFRAHCGRHPGGAHAPARNRRRRPAAGRGDLLETGPLQRIDRGGRKRRGRDRSGNGAVPGAHRRPHAAGPRDHVLRG